jgi:hypothetical protein
MSDSRLSTVCPDLDEALNSAPLDRRLRAGWVAARWAIEQTGLSHPVVSAAKMGSTSEPISALVVELDERYFDLQESCDEGECSKEAVLTAFGRARAANALEFAVRGDAAEAVYEATMCSDDVAALRRVLASALA